MGCVCEKYVRLKGLKDSDGILYILILSMTHIENEIWKTIEEFPIYEVSNLGRIKNTSSGRILSPTIKAGYYHVSLTNSNYKKNCKVHRLVAITFISNAENKSEVNHKDKDKLNNKLDNLEWMTRKENCLHKSIGLIYKSNKHKSILRIDKDTNDTLEKYDSRVGWEMGV